jgi:hypothetical protein
MLIDFLISKELSVMNLFLQNSRLSIPTSSFEMWMDMAAHFEKRPNLWLCKWILHHDYAPSCIALFSSYFWPEEILLLDVKYTLFIWPCVTFSCYQDLHSLWINLIFNCFAGHLEQCDNSTKRTEKMTVGTSWGLVVSVTPQLQFNPREGTPIPIG